MSDGERFGLFKYDFRDESAAVFVDRDLALRVSDFLNKEELRELDHSDCYFDRVYAVTLVRDGRAAEERLMTWYYDPYALRGTGGTAAYLLAWCPNCRVYHHHGSGAFNSASEISGAENFGHRVPHCGGMNHTAPGYYLVNCGEAPAEILKDSQRKRPKGPDALGSES